MNSQGRQALEDTADSAPALEGRNFLWVGLSPLRDFGVSVSLVQGRAPTDRLVPLAIDCRPCRGLTNSCTIIYGIRDDDA